jgi:hypothetical protein
MKNWRHLATHPRAVTWTKPKFATCLRIMKLTTLTICEERTFRYCANDTPYQQLCTSRGLTVWTSTSCSRVRGLYPSEDHKQITKWWRQRTRPHDSERPHSRPNSLALGSENTAFQKDHATSHTARNTINAVNRPHRNTSYPELETLLGQKSRLFAGLFRERSSCSWHIKFCETETANSRRNRQATRMHNRAAWHEIRDQIGLHRGWWSPWRRGVQEVFKFCCTFFR